MIELFIVTSIASAIAAAFAPIAFGSYRAERQRIEAEQGAESFERKLPSSALTPRPATPIPQVIDSPIYQEPMKEPTRQVQPTRPTLSRRDELWQRLEEHEEGWILDILERPVLIWGAQGSAKSYFAAFLAALRIAYRGHKIEINDPHILLNRDKAWKPLLDFGVPAFGNKFVDGEEEGYNYRAIASRIKEFVRRLKAATPEKQWYSPIFDEVTQYSLEPDIKEVASTLTLKCVSDCRSGNEAPILLSHDKTQALTGGSSGTHQAKEEGLAQVHLLSTSKNGKQFPLFMGELTGIPNENGKFLERKITIDPKWMTADFVFQYLGIAQQEPPMPTEELEQEFSLISEQSKLGFLYSLPAETPQHEQPLSPQLQAILDYAKKRGGTVTARDIQRGNLKELVTFDVNSASNIRVYFEELARLGRGQLEGEGSEQRFIIG